MDLVSGTNSLLVRPFEIALFGGRAKGGETSLSFDPATGGLTGVAALKLEDLDLSRLPGIQASPPLRGNFGAEFGKIDLKAEKIAFEGDGRLAIFGGTAKVFNISVLNPFLPGRTLRCDADFEGIDLEKLTDVVPFGRVTGTVRGEVRGLALSYGQPEAFSFRVESVRRKGIGQKFSLRAVNNLSVISSGEKTAVVSSQWWLRFVSSFNYSKIGIASTLKNDVFTLHGTIVEKGVEYLVKKSSLFGISVVNRMPDKTISFKDMVLRLRRVGESGAVQ